MVFPFDKLYVDDEHNLQPQNAAKQTTKNKRGRPKIATKLDNTELTRTSEGVQANK